MDIKEQSQSFFLLLLLIVLEPNHIPGILGELKLRSCTTCRILEHVFSDIIKYFFTSLTLDPES